MIDSNPLQTLELEAACWQLYRAYIDKAEKKRHWNLRNDIPWAQCNPRLNPAVADVVETFYLMELYLPDYTSKILPLFRASRAQAWFYAHWGYEESKHVLVLGDWLLKAQQRTDEELADSEEQVYEREWNLPHDSQLGMLIYALVQELATFIHYRKLRHHVEEHAADPALARLLQLIALDERAHYNFFLRCVRLYLAYDRQTTLEQMRRVLNDFEMPALANLREGRRRMQAIEALHLFSKDIYYREAYLPLLSVLGVKRAEMGERVPEKRIELLHLPM